MRLRDIVFYENKLIGCEDRIITIWDPYSFYVYLERRSADSALV